MLTATEAAKQLGLSARKVYDLHASGELAGFRFGRAVRFDPADLEAYRTSCRSVGTPGTSNGASLSSERFKVVATDLAACFRKAGVKPKLTLFKHCARSLCANRYR